MISTRKARAIRRDIELVQLYLDTSDEIDTRFLSKRQNKILERFDENAIRYFRKYYPNLFPSTVFNTESN